MQPNPSFHNSLALIEARALFEQFEREADPSQKLSALEEAPELLDLVLV